MKLTRRNWFVLASGFVATVSAGPVFARSSVIKVSLWDKGANSMNMLGHGEMMGMGMGGTVNGMPMAPMGIRVSTQTISAGEVTFEVINSSTQMVHEMVISPVKDMKTPLPYDKEGNK